MTTILLIAILFFAAGFLGLITLFMSYAAVKASPRHELKKRLRNLALDVSDRRFPTELRIEILGEMSPLDRLLYRLRLVQSLHRFIDRAGLRIDVKSIIGVALLLAVAGVIVGILLNQGPVPSIILGIIGVISPYFFLKFKKDARYNKFLEQFPDVLDMIARSLQAGHSFSAAVQLVATETAEPTAGLFKTLYEEQVLGLSLRESLQHLNSRMDSTDLRFFILAVNIHREIGGNLGEILERLSRTIRERIRIKRQVRVYTAQARTSGYILAAAPIFMALFFYFTTPGYIEELVSVTWGWYAIFFAVSAQIAGFLVIKRIINIRI
ncbi:MAG TPA: type II secretion system F family protein [Thermodesulfobacteriota bacterium]|nr:type II secretion system F family protein [Thermodesulfobacteriota bacterium]